MAASGGRPESWRQYLADEIWHLVGRGFTVEQAVRFVAVQLKLSEPTVAEIASVEVTT